MLVLGGRGFIGRHAVKHLQADGAVVTIGSRRSDAGAMPAAESRTAATEPHVLHTALAAEDWHRVAERFDVVLNCVGILRQRYRETYDAVHHLAPSALASACARCGTRFVHVSALGLSLEARSRFLTSKVRGEQAIRAAGGDWYIARLSLLDGEGGFGATWLRGVARLPLFVVPASARGRIDALTADDAGRALSRLCLATAESLDVEISREYELGGDNPMDFESYVRGLRARHADNRALCVRIPGWLARAGAHLCDVVHFSPFSFGHWELLCRDNVPAPNRLGKLLGRKPEVVISTATS